MNALLEWPEIINQQVIPAAGFVGTIAFALSGVLAGARKQFDWVGVFIIALLTSCGGGMVRDLLLDRPVTILHSMMPVYVVLAMMALAKMFGLHRRPSLERQAWFVLCDSVGLAAFALNAALLAMDAGLTPFGVVAVAFITATGGGILRDMLVNEVPTLLATGFYGSVAVLMALAVMAVRQLGLLEEWAMPAIFLGGLGVRLLAWKQAWRLPVF
jgi:uncharacterized membrane protein YeiH